MAQKQAPMVGRTGAAPVVIEVTGEGPESNLALATSTSRLWCHRRSTPRMKKLLVGEKSPQVQHAVNGECERPLTPTENAAAVSPFRTRPRSRTGLPGHDGENRACIHQKTAVCRSVCGVEEMTRRTTEIAPWQPSFLAKSNPPPDSGPARRIWRGRNTWMS